MTTPPASAGTAAALPSAPPAQRPNAPRITVERFSFWYGEKQALRDVDLEIFDREVLAFIGPSGCGKSTLLRCLNRMNDHLRDVRAEGRIELDGVALDDASIDPPALRRRFGWVAQKPNPFPWSIRRNVAYGPSLHGLVSDQAETDALVERCLRAAALWDEVATRLDEPATRLSGGQQQRLCIARALSTAPEVLLMDEPCGSIDPAATARVEELIHGLRRDYAVVIITHNMEQARRLADRVAFFHMGRLLEVGPAEQVFLAPRTAECAAFISGRYG